MALGSHAIAIWQKTTQKGRPIKRTQGFLAGYAAEGTLLCRPILDRAQAGQTTQNEPRQANTKPQVTSLHTRRRLTFHKQFLAKRPLRVAFRRASFHTTSLPRRILPEEPENPKIMTLPRRFLTEEVRGRSSSGASFLGEPPCRIANNATGTSAIGLTQYEQHHAHQVLARPQTTSRRPRTQQSTHQAFHIFQKNHPRFSM